MQYQYQGAEVRPSIDEYHDIYPAIAGISMRDFFLDSDSCAEAWRAGRAYLNEAFGRRIPLRTPSPAPLSYGHIACLGAEVDFPENGEPNAVPVASSIDEALRFMESSRGTDYRAHWLFGRYLEVWERLKDAFPKMRIPFAGLGKQGPITTAVLLRGEDFFIDLYDEPEKTRQFLRLVTDDVIAFTKALRRLNGEPEKSAGGMVLDDFPSMISPAMWDDFVIPYIDRVYTETSTGPARFLHMENLQPQHLPQLKKLRLTHFQPSVSDHITLADVRAGLEPGVSFDWLLYSYRVVDMTDGEIAAWVDEALAAGVKTPRTQYNSHAWRENKLGRVLAFLHAFDRYRVPNEE